MNVKQIGKIRWFLTFLILIDFMGVAMVVVVFPHLFLSPESSLFPSTWSHGLRLSLLGFFLAIYPIGQFFGASIFGKISDHLGRQKVLMLTISGTFLGFILSASSIILSSYILLFVSRLLAGLCAGNVAVAQASLIDISTDEKSKAHNLTYSQIAMGSAYIVGPILGSILSNSNLIFWFNLSTPFWFFSVLLALLLLATKIMFVETLTEKQNIKIDFLSGVKQIKSAFTRKSLRVGFLVWFIFVAGWWLFESYMPAFLYQKFNFSTASIGNVLSFNGALYALYQYFIVRPSTKYMNAKSMVKYSCVFTGLSIAGLALVTTAWQLYVVMAAFVISMDYAIPGLITYISNLASKNEQGQILGMINSIQAFATVLVMICGGFMNSLNVNYTIIGGGLLVILGWLLFTCANTSYVQSKNTLENISN